MVENGLSLPCAESDVEEREMKESRERIVFIDSKTELFPSRNYRGFSWAIPQRSCCYGLRRERSLIWSTLTTQRSRNTVYKDTHREPFPYKGEAAKLHAVAQQRQHGLRLDSGHRMALGAVECTQRMLVC